MHAYKADADTTEARIARHALAHIGLSQLSQQSDTWDLIVTVPSTRRTGPTPLDKLASTWSAHLSIPNLRTLETGPGRIGRRMIEPNAVIVTTPSRIEGRRVLLIDDTYVTGAHLHAAGNALTEAGAQHITGFSIARKITPSIEHDNHHLTPVARHLQTVDTGRNTTATTAERPGATIRL